MKKCYFVTHSLQNVAYKGSQGTAAVLQLVLVTAGAREFCTMLVTVFWDMAPVV
jgi:hypothetical protein